MNRLHCPKVGSILQIQSYSYTVLYSDRCGITPDRCVSLCREMRYAGETPSARMPETGSTSL